MSTTPPSRQERSPRSSDATLSVGTIAALAVGTIVVASAALIIGRGGADSGLHPICQLGHRILERARSEHHCAKVDLTMAMGICEIPFLRPEKQGCIPALEAAIHCLDHHVSDGYECDETGTVAMKPTACQPEIEAYRVCIQ